MPFRRLKVRLKKEIVTLGDAAADPTRQVGTYVEAADWNALIAAPDTLVIDTRNAFEVAMGTFEGAVDPGISELWRVQGFRRRSSSIPRSTARSRCSAPAASAAKRRARYLLARGFAEVYHLKGGILKYLEERAGGARAAGAANVSCSTSASRSAMACANGDDERT